MARYRSFRDLDWSLLVITLIISALGVLQIFSATHDTKWRDAWWKQILWILIAVGIMWVITSIDYHTLLGQVPAMYVVAIAVLLGTEAVGKRVFGSRRWISVAGFNFQISEFVKLVIILLVARYLSELKKDEVGLRDLLKLGVLVGIPTALVMYQPDLGTALTYLPILAVGILLAGL
jgi:rod shape determining protein RodA